MSRQMLGVILGLALAGGVAANAMAQAPAAGAGRAGGRGGGGAQAATPPAQLDSALAKQIIAAAEAAAVKEGAHVAIAVVDANGDLVAFHRLDGATGRGVVSAESKARTAILFGVPTRDVEDAVTAGKPVSVTLTPTSAPGTSDVWIRQGGIPLIRAGKVIGGVGVGGGSGGQDEAVAKAGADVLK